MNTKKQAIEESARAAYVDEQPRPRTHRNPRIAALQLANPHWKDPPGEDARLVWRFNVADAECGERSGGWPSGPKNADEHPAFDESNSAQARAVANMDRYSPAARRRETDGHLAQLSAFDVGVLRRAYGPEEQSGPNAVHPQTKARMGTLARARIAEVTESGKRGAGSNRPAAVARWLRHEASVDEVDAVKGEADALLFAAHNRYCDVRGRRRSVERHALERTLDGLAPRIEQMAKTVEEFNEWAKANHGEVIVTAIAGAIAKEEARRR